MIVALLESMSACSGGVSLLHIQVLCSIAKVNSESLSFGNAAEVTCAEPMIPFTYCIHFFS